MEIAAEDKTASGAQWSVQKITLHGGKQEGVDVVLVDNGRLKFLFASWHGRFVGQPGGCSLRLEFSVKEVVHPQYINLQSRNRLGWLEGFNEWMVRCGLENNGHPGIDKFINNVGDEATMEHIPSREDRQHSCQRS